MSKQPCHDIVNAYFRQFYPDDYATNWELRACGAGYGREYQDRQRYDHFPMMVCQDGFSFSVQGHYGAYSHPRDDYAEKYTDVEVWCLSEPEPLLDPWGDGSDPYAYVPVSVVAAIVEKHGGLAP